jgi:multiple sugar transport system substrate-binding protein
MFWSLYGDQIKKKFPHITPKYIANTSTPIEQLITAGAMIDFMLVTPAGTRRLLIDNKLNTDLSDLIKETKFDLKRFDPTIVSMQQDIAKGGMYGLPAFIQFPILFYNKSLFDKFGVPYPKMGMTWDETYRLAASMSRTADGTRYYGFGTTPTFHYKTSQLPLALVNPQTNKALNNEKVKQVVENFSRFSMIPGYEFTERMSRGSDLENMFFKDQTLAMYAHFTNVSRRLPDTEILNWDAVSLPYYPEAMGVAPSVDPFYLYLTSMSKHKKQAFDVAAFLTSTEVQVGLAREGFTPAIRGKEVQDAFGKNNKNYSGKNVSAFFPDKFAEAPPFSPYYAIADTSLLTGVAKLVTGKADINTALREYEEEANKRIEDQIRSEK